MTPGNQLPVAEPLQVRRAAVALVRRDARTFAAVLALNTAAAAAGVASPWLLGRIVDEVAAGADVGRIDRLAAAVVVFAVVQLVLTRYANYSGSRFGERAQASLREEFLDRVLLLPPSVVERAGTGDLAARGTGDVELLGSTLREAGPTVLIAALRALIIVAAVFVVSPLLGVCGVLGLLGIHLAGRWYLRRARRDYLVAGAASSALAEQLTASARGARTIDALRLQERRKQVCADAIANSRRAQTRTLFLRSVLYPSVDLSCAAAVALVVWIGAALLDDGRLTIGAVVAAALYVQQLSQPIASILMWVEQLQSSAASLARVEGVGAALPPSVPGARGELVPTDDVIEARDVFYGYEADIDVVRGVSFTVQPGERLAIVGPSGAGKTTLGRLLAGSDTPRSGSITVGTVPVAELPADVLRQHILSVTEDQHVFLGSVRDNLLLGSPGADDEQLRRALEAVGADWVDELPEGIDTPLGADGSSVDAAQSQQLALARVVLADPHTLVLDEATSLLDPRTARRAERALSAVLRGRTIIAIAHRLQTARDASRVALMEGGRIVEVGTHEELLERDGVYAALWHAWDDDRHE